LARKRLGEKELLLNSRIFRRILEVGRQESYMFSIDAFMTWN